MGIIEFGIQLRSPNPFHRLSDNLSEPYCAGMRGEGGENGLLVGDVLAGLVPDSGEVVASSIELQ
jgi:hypothetical protein